MTLRSGPIFFRIPDEPNRAGSGEIGIAAEIIAGLMAESPWVSPKYFYDPLGSHLFEAITELPEYYLTRTEKKLLAGHIDEIARAVGTGLTLIDLGAGNCEKAKGLLGALAPAQYVAVDISVDFLRGCLESLQLVFPRMDILGVGVDFSTALRLPEAVCDGRRLFFYPGSSIGNFTPQEALAFLARIRRQCLGGGLLIGVDLVKSETVLNAAYDDALGVTAAFNLNLFRHLNALIGSDFALGDWKHRAFYNGARSRIEMHLEAKRDTAVRWTGGGRTYYRGQRIHTENSYKYALPDFKAMLAQAGFSRVHAWTDENDWFALCLALA